MNFIHKLLMFVFISGAALVYAGSDAKPAGSVQSRAAAVSEDVNDRWMLEGEKRYRTNCVRCHQAPSKFPPRAMAMIVRHMRVRAMLREEDAKYVLYFMTH